MSDPTPTLEYRTLGPEDHEREVQAADDAKWLGCWTTVAAAIGLPMVCGLVASEWVFRDQIGSLFWFLLYAGVIIVAGLALGRKVRRHGRWRAFVGGLALGLAALAAMIVIAFAVVMLLVILLK